MGGCELTMAASHQPVLLDRVLDLFAPALSEARSAGSVGVDPVGSGPVVIDATVGMGGHSAALLERFPGVGVVGIDRDPQALEAAAERLAGYGDRVLLQHAVYDEIDAVLTRLGIDQVQGVIFDLGVSSLQLDERDRGFSYRDDAPLDMRMDSSHGRTAADLLNTADVGEITSILREYGEERFARRIAERIVAERRRAPFTGSARLVDLIREAIPAPARRTGGHPAKRTFQALRIAVNDELDALRRALPAAVRRVAPSGRLVVLAYHSLEDRLVKRTFADLTRPDVPAGVPVIPDDRREKFQLVTRGAERPSAAEVDENPRAASARLRAVERIRP